MPYEVTVSRSTFRGTHFDWEFANPKRTIQDGALHLSGSVIFYRQADLDAMFAYMRPCTVRTAGDPTAGGLTYVDHWGPDPSGPLIMNLLLPDTNSSSPTFTFPVPTQVTYTAILTNLSRNEALPGGVHKAEADFIIMVDVLLSIPGQSGSAGTGQTGGQTGGTGPGPVTPGSGGSTVTAVMGTDTSNTRGFSLWNGTDNDPPPDGWEQPDFDYSGFDPVVPAAGAVSAWQTTTAVWTTTVMQDTGEEVLFHQTFSVPPTGTIIGAICRISVYGSNLSGVWINGVELAGDSGTPTGLTFDPTILLPGQTNHFSASAVSDTRGQMDALIELTISA